MELLELYSIATRYMELVNPSSPEKVLQVGQMAGMTADSHVIDFGCGFGLPLALWADRFGISGVGVELRAYTCERAIQKMTERGLADRIAIVCQNAAQYPFETGAFDVAVCMGATFIWGGFRPTVQVMSRAIHARGRLIVGEPYWLTSQVPPAYAKQIDHDMFTERELLSIARDEGFDVLGVVRASHDDWDRYQSDNWYGLLRWLDDHADHPERQAVIDFLHRDQDEYFTHGREYLGWAMYVLNPVGYRGK